MERKLKNHVMFEKSHAFGILEITKNLPKLNRMEIVQKIKDKTIESLEFFQNKSLDFVISMFRILETTKY